jgi:hypothetical protein
MTADLPRRARAIINECRRGANMCLYLHAKPGGAKERRFSLFPSGKACIAHYAELAITSGELKPQHDGSFGDELSQTWAAKGG